MAIQVWAEYQEKAMIVISYLHPLIHWGGFPSDPPPTLTALQCTSPCLTTTQSSQSYPVPSKQGVCLWESPSLLVSTSLFLYSTSITGSAQGQPGKTQKELKYLIRKLIAVLFLCCPFYPRKAQRNWSYLHDVSCKDVEPYATVPKALFDNYCWWLCSIMTLKPPFISDDL